MLSLSLPQCVSHTQQIDQSLRCNGNNNCQNQWIETHSLETIVNYYIINFSIWFKKTIFDENETKRKYLSNQKFTESLSIRWMEGCFPNSNPLTFSHLVRNNFNANLPAFEKKKVLRAYLLNGWCSIISLKIILDSKNSLFEHFLVPTKMNSCILGDAIFRRKETTNNNTIFFLFFFFSK